MRKVKIDVTDEDINRGKETHSINCTNCPIALAASRALGYPTKVGYAHITWINENADMLINALPLEATEFIRKFDVNFPVDPFSFEIELGE